MRFASDLILFDIQTTGPNLEKDHIIQLACVVLDKENLLEKYLFNTYIRTSLMESVLGKQAMELGISVETMKKAPKTIDAVKYFLSSIESSNLLASHTPHNLLFLRTLFKKVSMDFPFGSQFFSVWTLGYLYTLQHGLKKQPSFDTLLSTFNMRIENPNNAYERVRLEADILRKLITTFTS